MSLKEKLAKIKFKPLPTGPVWEGPDGTGPNGGITFSNLSRFICCRERFRLMMVEGLKPADKFNSRLSYGQMWHICEEELAGAGDTDWDNPDALVAFFHPLTEYCKEQCKRYPLQQEEIDKWYRACKVQFPVYVKYWENQPDVLLRTPVFQERAFNVPHKLPSGRIVRLRGKQDSVDLVGRPKGRDTGIYLQENKSKGEIDEVQLNRQLTFDLQTMMYLIALYNERDSLIASGFAKTARNTPENILATNPIRGVRYNVVRRPMSGGKGSIVRHKAKKSNKYVEESKDDYYTRLGKVIEDNSNTFFLRWKIDITEREVLLFRKECLDPILEQLCDWWEWIKVDPSNPYREGNTLHFREPYGVYNVLLEGGSSDYDHLLSTRSEVGLERVDNLFPELS